MRRAHWHTFQVLTKRAERLEELNPQIEWPENAFFHAPLPGAGRDSILLLGIEPAAAEGERGAKM